MAETASFVAVVATEGGGSAFVDRELELEKRFVAEGMPALLAAALPSAAGVAYLRGAPFESEPHAAPRRQWVILLRGAFEIEVSDGTRRTFRPGDLLLAEDVTGRGHTTRTVGDPPFEALFVPAG